MRITQHSWENERGNDSNKLHDYTSPLHTTESLKKQGDQLLAKSCTHVGSIHSFQ